MEPSGRTGRWTGRHTLVAALFIAQFVALLAVGTYASSRPTLFGFPFFYWYTLLWLLVGAISMAAALVLLPERDGTSR